MSDRDVKGSSTALTDRDGILANLPSASGGGLPAVFERVRPSQSPPARAKLSDPEAAWLAFDEAFVGLGGQVVPIGGLSLLLGREGGVWADDDTIAFLPKFGRADSVWEAEIGICLADLAIAETGTLLVSACPGRGRLTSLAPPVNVILIHHGAIVDTPEEAFAKLPKATSVMISGTSRTGDIEGILVRGVHGPRELYLVRI